MLCYSTPAKHGTLAKQQQWWRHRRRQTKHGPAYPANSWRKDEEEKEGLRIIVGVGCLLRVVFVINKKWEPLSMYLDKIRVGLKVAFSYAHRISA